MPVSPNHANRRKSSDATASLQQQQQAFVLDSKTPQEFKRQLHDHMAEKEKEQALEARRHAQAVAQTADAQRNLEEFGANVMDDAALLMHRAARTGEALRDAGASELGAIPPSEHPAHHHKVIDLDEVTTAAKRKAPAAAVAAAPDDDDVALHRRHRPRHHLGEPTAQRKEALRRAIFRAPGFTSALDWPRMLLAPLGHEARQALGFFLVLVLPISVAYLLLFSSYRPSLNKLEHFIEKLPKVKGGMRRGGQMPNGAWDDGVGTCWVSPAAATAAWTHPTTFELGSGSGFVHCDPLSAPNGKCYLHASTAGPI